MDLSFIAGIFAMRINKYIICAIKVNLHKFITILNKPIRTRFTLFYSNGPLDFLLSLQ